MGGFDSYSDEKTEGAGLFHTAGYDAYQTGRIFAFFRSVLGEAASLEYANRVFLMGTIYGLRFDQDEDDMIFDSIGRYLYRIDSSIIQESGLREVLKATTVDSNRKLIMKWCWCKKSSQLRHQSMLLLLAGPDTAPTSKNRQALEQTLDDGLRRQKDMGRLDYCTIEEHLQQVQGGAVTVERAAKRQRGSN